MPTPAARSQPPPSFARRRLVAFPPETVRLGATPSTPKPYAHLRVKGRPRRSPLIVHVRISRNWPGRSQRSVRVADRLSSHSGRR